ncbi:MAG: hypothetical protein ACM30I_13460 [Gemmatimonas sp.]
MDTESRTENQQEILQPGQSFEGSRPGKGTALLVGVVAAGVALYNFWPQIASALDFG